MIDRRKYGPVDIRGHEAFDISGPGRFVDMDLTGKCGACGGKLVRVGRRLEWRCENSRWWNRWKHVRLIAKVPNVQ